MVILCAQTQESVRILLNSQTPAHPGGLANSSGVLGHYFTSHVSGVGAAGEFPALDSQPSLGGPKRPVEFYVACFRNVKNQPPAKDFGG